MAPETSAAGSELKGVGIWVAQLFEEEAPGHRGALVVLEVLPRSPASMAGLRAGDRIARIGENSTRGMTLEEAVTQHLRAGDGAQLKVELERVSGVTSIDIRIESSAEGFLT